MFWQRFKELCNKVKKSPNAITKELGLSSATATSWKSGTVPNGAALIAIAECFNVSVDYLLGLTDNPRPRDDGEEVFGNITEDEHAALEAFLKAYREQKKKN